MLSASVTTASAASASSRGASDSVRRASATTSRSCEKVKCSVSRLTTARTKEIGTSSSSSFLPNRPRSKLRSSVRSGVVTNGVTGSSAMSGARPSLPRPIVPLRNCRLLMCPSPVARRLRMNRLRPRSSPDWSGCQTIDGLNSAAASRLYSLVK